MSGLGIEQELIAAAASGDRMALQRLLLDHYGRLRDHVAPKIPLSQQSVVDVDDILQQTFFQAFRDIGQFAPGDQKSFSAWLMTIAENRLLDVLKTQKRKKRGGGFRQVRRPRGERASSMTDLVELLSGNGDTPSQVGAGREAARAIRVGLAGLPGDQQEAIRLRYFDGRSVQQTAAAMDRSPGAVRGLVYRAKRALRDTLGRSSRWFGKK